MRRIVSMVIVALVIVLLIAAAIMHKENGPKTDPSLSCADRPASVQYAGLF